MNKAELFDAIVFFKTITLKKTINGFLLRLSYFISKSFGLYIHWGKPESLSIEPTNLCNLECPECPSGSNAMTRARLFLSQNNFENTINQTSKYLSSLQLFFQGEPFMHPKIYDFIAYAVSKKIYTSTSTNGQFLTAENCDKIVNSGLHRLIVSVDGTTQDVYEKYRVGGSLDLVTGGIKNLLKTKKRLKSKTPFIIMQFVVFKSNEHQIPDIKNLAKLLKVDKLNIKSAQIKNFEKDSSLIPKNKKYSRYYLAHNGKNRLKRNLNFKCWRIWSSFVLSAENQMLPCCFDKNADYEYNQPNSKNILSIWQGNKVRQFRKQVWNKHNTINMCKNCTEGLIKKKKNL